MEGASRLPWQVSLVLAVVSGTVLHVLATALSVPKVQASGALDSIVVRGFYGTIAAFLQFIVPVGFLVGSAVALMNRSRTTALFRQAQSTPHPTINKMTLGRV